MRTMNSSLDACVTVITPIFNGVPFLKRYFKMLAEQTEPFNVLIVDDASTDQLSTELDYYIKEMPFDIILLANQANIGPAQSRARAVAYCDTKYVAFCDIDDTWPADKLKIQVEHMNLGACVWSYHGRRLTFEDGSPSTKIDVTPIRSLSHLMISRHIGLSSVMVRTEEAKRLPDCSGIYLCEDYVWWGFLFDKYGAPFPIFNLNYEYNIHSTSASRNKLKMARAVFKLYVWQRRFPVSRLYGLFMFFGYALNGIFGMVKQRFMASR
jgi:teichuronic acid biosynthesis glycosyltransferase TuaG